MRTAILLLAAALAGCAREDEAAPPDNPGNAAANAAAAEPTAQAEPQPQPAAQAVAPLTPEGWGPLRIGMTSAEVAAVMGGDSDPEEVGGPEPESCDQWRPARAPEGLLVMIEEGRLTSISLIDDAPVRTDRGLGLGARADAVRQAYGAALQAARHQYQEPPAEYLTFWIRGGPRNASEGTQDANARGVLYEVDGSGVVRRISAGGPSIQYVEGCA